MPFRIAKSFTVESGHMLSKHPGRCRFPHGHSRTITLVVAAPTLDAHDMVCDFKALKLALDRVCDRFDHSLSINAADPLAKHLSPDRDRLVVFEGQDPTTEILAQRIYHDLDTLLKEGAAFTARDGLTYRLPAGLAIERVRVTETDSTWAEYAP
ncbi:MAG: 6-carboxy-5,6,7,8-tetrahydropterin synthase [Phycisphaerae bacterium]|nr:MAG: 6-carboxy-5,6,7,8-tetrahydropterin synthase [Phycisphaerae bacterium]